jgi:hypothetical protein
MTEHNGREHRSGRSRADWERLVSKFERSGLSRKAFCERAAVSTSTFDYWRRKLAAKAPGFIELPPVERGGAWEVELDLGGGVALRLRRG